MVVQSWDGKRVEAITEELGCDAQTVRRRLHFFDAEGVEGLGEYPKAGRPHRLTVEDYGKLIALARQAPPGRQVTRRDGTMVAREEGSEAQWSLKAWPEQPKKRVSQSNVARSVASSYAKRCAGATPIVGVNRTTKALSQKSGGRRPLHRAFRGVDDHLTDELGPVAPCTFDPAPGWSPDSHRIKAPLEYGRGLEKTWVYGALRVRDGKEITRCAASRNSKGYIELLKDIEADNPTGEIFIITDNLSSHNSLETRTDHPRLHHVFIPTGTCWLNLQEGWWRLFRRDATFWAKFRQSQRDRRVATVQLNRRARPWVWGRTPKDHRHYRRVFSYRI
jgi:hypothetical protein